ncbi:DUF1559 family PulG-like putative transporter [Gimesia fumaroli]|uniref:DUF1559 domain-containing protein n=1 Tax=Gimesia fumaroli TaxID=2527976 RepID=A0A518IEF3_9PLAN|nr:DUF1559 domain-containing protein [Gimesia fumaroli]QDV51469.1 hypothetical protein Enr17x_35250 [Gimesia fumaroli]
MENETSEKKTKKPQPVLLIVLVSLLLIGFGLPIYHEIRSNFQERSYRRHQLTRRNMKQIGLALHNYHWTNHTLPPGAMISESGIPEHSWQALILPFLDQEFLFKQIDLKKPWNDPANQKVFQQKIPVYLSPKVKMKFSKDGYALSHFVGNQLVLKPGTNISFEDIRDGTSNTILAMEIAENFKPWGDPSSLTDPTKVIGPDMKTPSTGGSFILLGDGAVRYISKDVDPAVLKALSTPDGGEVVGEF